ncbi:MAG: DUF1028 domain-containing protein [Bacillota bacterium]|nr:DUF1028 domain-containing protein [Bacillota bacterium]MDW7682690.1 DUF1028 domain-containing protein [Bacillota bacterium]
MTKTTKPINTFSIVGYDPTTGESGVAVASKFLAAAAVVPWARAGAGAIATQSWANLEFGTKGLELLAAGKSAQEVLDELVAADEGRAVRQVGIVDERGGSASYTGDECYDWAGGITGPNFACQGNILVSEETVKAMAEAFQSTTGDLADRLVAALLAGDEAGGDNRGKQSAGLLIVKEAGGYGGVTDKYIDLRVDDHKEPVRELARILKLHKLYFKKSAPEDIIPVEGDVKATVTSLLTSLGYISTQQLGDEEIFEALKSFHLIENFDERVQEPGLVDKKVIEFMEQLVKETDS